MIDPMLSLVLSVHSNKGVYALLIGSGVSRSAGIPTGWEVVEDLIRKLAHVEGEDCGPDPAAWFKDKIRGEPDYAKLLDGLSKSPSVRSQLLRSYFEPNDEERELGLKAPTAAHRAIAEFVSSGYIRVIVTTNFDRLLEMALEEVGVVPTVISTTDAIQGARPLTHTSCTIIKVHGDYLDTRIKNTPKELGKYDRPMNTLLDRVFDEFGLVVCGWSAEWDPALRAAIERCKSHNFTTFWTVRREPEEVTNRLIELRRAEVIRIQNADAFFQELWEKVSSLEDMGKLHPLSVKSAVGTVKRYLSEDRYKIPLNDLVVKETEKLYSELSDENFPLQGIHPTGEEMLKRLRKYESLVETLQAIIITGCHWGERTHEILWVRCLERIANPLGGRPGLNIWLSLRYYPALLLLYSGGIASIAREQYSTFSTLLNKVKVRDNGRQELLIFSIHPILVLDHSEGQLLPGRERQYTPLNNHLYEVLREPLREFLPDDTQYKRYFDRFEYFLALIHADLCEQHEFQVHWPAGLFYSLRRYRPESHIMEQIQLEAASAGEDWPPLRAGFFNGSYERFQQIKEVVDEHIKRHGWM